MEIFRAHFGNYADRYLLIGGAACDIAMAEAGLTFRATKDLDIVLYVEALDAAFVQAFWEFVRAGGYEVQEKSTGEKQFYRFQRLTNSDYPFMLELFSRQPDVLQVPEGSHPTSPSRWFQSRRTVWHVRFPVLELALRSLVLRWWLHSPPWSLPATGGADGSTSLEAWGSSIMRRWRMDKGCYL